MSTILDILLFDLRDLSGPGDLALRVRATCTIYVIWFAIFVDALVRTAG